MTVVAKYIGKQDDKYYLVNVKNAKPSGKIGDAGVIRRFETKEEAKAYTKTVNETGIDTFVKNEDKILQPTLRHEGDLFISSNKLN